MSDGKGPKGYHESFAGVAGGSACVDNVLNPGPARRLGDRTADAVLASGAEVLVTANRGCLMQGASALDRAGGSITLAHTVEALDASTRSDSPSQFTSLRG